MWFFNLMKKLHPRNVRRLGFLGLVMGTAVLGFGVPPIFAEDLSPIGRWNTVSDINGKVTSIMKLSVENGMLIGKVEKLIRRPDQDPNPLCKKCPGEKKDQPLQGMTILWDLQYDEGEWNGGYVLDPDSGTTYRCIVTVMENGAQLHVRGYIGFSIFGRTQVWLRAE